MVRSIARLAAWLLCLGAAGFFIFEIAALVDLFGFELAALYRVVGVSGVALVVALNAGLLLLVWCCRCWLRRTTVPHARLVAGLLAVWVVLGLWLAEWLFLETPLSVRVELAMQDDAAALTFAPSADFDGFSIVKQAPSDDARRSLRIMYERIRINDPEVYARHPIGATIDKYATQHDVDPLVLFFFNYVCSFWGEAVSGPTPFTHSMSAETLRDIIQVHLPGWFIESDSRRALIREDTFERALGQGIGFKLRYALHKANLDVSTQPFDLNLFSDVFLVLRQYPQFFPELTESPTDDPVVTAMRESFRVLHDDALRPPYESPYEGAPLGEAYYDAHRQDMKKFARATYYLTARDFDFATRAISLVIAYQRDVYKAHIGAERWNSLPNWQQASMLGMTRDLYVPNVGREGYNVYALPELNCTPVEFVAVSAAEEHLPDAAMTTTWRPRDYTKLWGGAATKLRILSELWTVVHGEELPGLEAIETLPDAHRIVVLAGGGQ